MDKASPDQAELGAALIKKYKRAQRERHHQLQHLSQVESARNGKGLGVHSCRKEWRIMRL